MKSTYQISSLHLKSLDNAEFFQLMTETKEAIATFTKTNKQEAAYANRLPQLTDLLGQLESRLHKSKASHLSAPLDEADRARDDALTTLTSLVRAFSRVKDAETKAAYTPLAQLFKNYAGLSTQSYEKETEGINHLLNQLKEAHYQTALTRLHLSVHVETLKTAQKQFEKVYKERLAEQSSQTPSQIKEIRQQLQELHEFYVDFTAITAYAYPDRTAYASLRDQLNTIRDRYKKLQPTKKTNKIVAMSSENGTV